VSKTASTLVRHFSTKSEQVTASKIKRSAVADPTLYLFGFGPRPEEPQQEVIGVPDIAQAAGVKVVGIAVVRTPWSGSAGWVVDVPPRQTPSVRTDEPADGAGGLPRNDVSIGGRSGRTSRFSRLNRRNLINRL
jgi:hypothetical protein